MFLRWARNPVGTQFGITLYSYGRELWRIEASFGRWILMFGRSFFYTRRKQEMRDAS